MEPEPTRLSYLKESHSLLYSYLICLPLFLLYELLIFISQPDTEQIIRISVDAWFKGIFTTFGLNALSITFFIACLAGVWILIRERHKLRHLRTSYFLFMILEAVVYAVALAILISSFLQFLIMIDQGSPLEHLTRLQLIALSLGAGLYEELFFRVILVSLLLWIFNRRFEKRWISYTLAALLAALIFSGVHYTGSFGDSFTISSFLFRFLFGLALNVIYVLRGFGMAAWTHAIYDLLIITIRY